MNKKYAAIIDDVIAEFDKGVIPWRQGINFALMRHSCNYVTGREYRGMNRLMLMAKGGKDHRYMTYKQAEERRFKVKKGAKGVPLFFYSKVEKEDKDTGESKVTSVFKTYHVFNCSDIDGVPEFESKDVNHAPEDSDIIQTIAKECNATIEHREVMRYAFYNKTQDFIALPSRGKFENPEHYNSTLAHELIHWTMSKDRCDRTLEYAHEELVAELGTLFLFSDLGIECDFPNHASYLSSWSRLLKDKPGSLMKAATLASKAIDFIQESSVTFRNLKCLEETPESKSA